MFRHLTSLFTAVLLCGSVVFAAPARADVSLLMAEEPGCIWCAQWNSEIGPIYDLTGEGAAAPLRRMDIAAPLPDDIALARAINFTPTFVLLIDGTEASRIEGYPGEDFFWGLVGMMLDKNEIPYTIKTNDGAGGL